jgi:hypothetical protein
MHVMPSVNPTRNTAMEALLSRALYHPATAHPMMYLTDILSRADGSIGAAVIVLIGSLTIQLTNSLRPSKAPDSIA